MSTIKDLMRANLLKSGDELVWNRRVQKVKHVAVVTESGGLKTADGESHKTPSGAAKHLNGSKPVDGWLAWKTKATGASLAELRSKLS